MENSIETYILVSRLVNEKFNSWVGELGYSNVPYIRGAHGGDVVALPVAVREEYAERGMSPCDYEEYAERGMSPCDYEEDETAIRLMLRVAAIGSEVVCPQYHGCNHVGTTTYTKVESRFGSVWVEEEVDYDDVEEEEES